MKCKTSSKEEIFYVSKELFMIYLIIYLMICFYCGTCQHCGTARRACGTLEPVLSARHDANVAGIGTCRTLVLGSACLPLSHISGNFGNRKFSAVLSNYGNF